MDLSFDGLNWPAVIVATIAYFVLGAVWYAKPVLGKVWTDASGMPMGGADGRPEPVRLIGPAIASFLFVIVLGVLALATRADGARDGAVLGLVTAVGFVLPIAFNTANFDSKMPKPMVWASVVTGYHVLGNVAAGIILATWT